MFKKLLSDNRNMQLSNRPVSPSRSTTPSRLKQHNLFNPTHYEFPKSPSKQYSDLSKHPNQYLSNHLQRKFTSPLKSAPRSPSPLVRKNTYEHPNNRSPLKTLAGFGNLEEYEQSRMPQSCYVPSSFIDSTQGKQNTKSNMPLFAGIIRDQNIRSENCKNLHTKRQQKEGISFMSLINKQYSLGPKPKEQNQESKSNYEKGSMTTADFSSGKKMSFKDSLKGKPRISETIQSLSNQGIVLEKTNFMLDSVGTISGQDRVNESIAEESFMDLNMDPCFDM